MNVSVPRQWLGREAKVAAGYKSVGSIRKYQGGCQPPAGYPQYVIKKQAEYGHHLVVMPNNEAHGQVGQLQPGTPGVGQYTVEREQKSEIFRAQYPERYTGKKTEVHPTIAGMMQNYNTKFSDLCISNLCKMTGVKIYGLPSVKGFDDENGQLHTCNMFTLKQCRNNICKMAHLLPTEKDKSYPDQLVKIMSTGVAAAVTKPKG